MMPRYYNNYYSENSNNENNRKESNFDAIGGYEDNDYSNNHDASGDLMTGYDPQ